MIQIITIFFLIFTYFIQRGIYSSLFDDIINTLNYNGFNIKENSEKAIGSIIIEYSTAYNYEKILSYLSILPIFNVVYATYTSLVYMSQKDSILFDLKVNDLIVENNDDECISIIDESINKIDNILNKYQIGDTKPKIKQKKKEH